VVLILVDVASERNKQFHDWVAISIFGTDRQIEQHRSARQCYAFRVVYDRPPQVIVVQSFTHNTGVRIGNVKIKNASAPPAKDVYSSSLIVIVEATHGTANTHHNDEYNQQGDPSDY